MPTAYQTLWQIAVKYNLQIPRTEFLLCQRNEIRNFHFFKGLCIYILQIPTLTKSGYFTCLLFIWVRKFLLLKLGCVHKKGSPFQLTDGKTETVLDGGSLVSIQQQENVNSPKGKDMDVP